MCLLEENMVRYLLDSISHIQHDVVISLKCKGRESSWKMGW